MARSLHPATLFVATLAGALAFWLSLEISQSAAVESRQATSHLIAADPAPIAAAPAPATTVATAGAPAPDRRTKRRTPLVPLPASGTPTLEVEAGAQVELRTSPGGEVVETLADTTEFGSPTVLTVLERRGNWAGVPTHHLPNGDLGWVELDEGPFEIGSVGHAVTVDLSSMSAELRRGDRVVTRWRVSVGGAESPTPTGRFSITDELVGGLNPVYGCCALALSATQPNPPPGWTAGTRMAIHGSTEEFGVANSAGCVRSAEDDLYKLIDAAPLGTPVTIKR